MGRNLIRIRGPLILVASSGKENRMGRPLAALGNSVSRCYETYTRVKDPEGMPHSGERWSWKSICGYSIWDGTVGVDGGAVNLEWNVVVSQNMALVMLVLQRAASRNPRRSIQTTTSHETRCFQFVCFLSSVSFQRMLVFELCDLCLLSHRTHFVIQNCMQTHGLWQTAASGSS